MPYMLDDWHVEDSLFIVLEEDFKLFAGSVEPIASEPKLTKGQTFLQQDLPTRGGERGTGIEDIAGPLVSTTRCPRRSQEGE